MKRVWTLAAAALGAAAAACAGAMAGAGAAEIRVDPDLPRYAAVQGVAGSIKSAGSDTMNNLMTLWSEEFRKLYPGVTIEIEGKGSSTAPTALIESIAQFGPMSRPMKGSEIDAFEKKFGYKPTVLRPGIDALAVYVHKDNPLDALTMEQVRRIFSVEGPSMTWGDLGLTGEWADKPISLYGRNSASGTYGFFKDQALGGKDYKATVKEQAGSSAVVQGVATDKYGMGYSGIGYRTADVRAVPLAIRPGEAPFEPSYENALSGRYPLARYLYVYVNHQPGSEMDPLRREFVRFMLSQQGQEMVVKSGYDPVPAGIAAEDLKKIGAE